MNKKVFFKWIFSLASIYSCFFGVVSVFKPLLFFEIFSLPPINYMLPINIVGVFSLVLGYGFWVITKNLNKYPHIAVMAILAKILVPAIWIYNIYLGNLPPLTFLICFINDILWLPFFIWYLQWNHDLRYGKN